MDSQKITARFERFYLASQRSPWKHLAGCAWAFLLVLLVESCPADIGGWLFGGALVCVIFIAPFLSGYLPFSPPIHEAWKKERIRRRQYPMGPPDSLIASGGGFVLGEVAHRFYSGASGNPIVLPFGCLLVALGLLTLLIERCPCPKPKSRAD